AVPQAQAPAQTLPPPSVLPPVPGGKSVPGETVAEEFLRIGKAMYDSDCAPVGAEPARTLQRTLEAGGLPAEQRLSLQLDLAHEWLELAKVQDSIDLLLKTAAELEGKDKDPFTLRVHRELGLAYMRQA